MRKRRWRRKSVCAYVACQVKLFLHFLLMAPYLFNCLSASLLGYVPAPGACLCVCLSAATAKRKEAVGLLRWELWGEHSNLSRGGFVSEIQMFIKWRDYLPCCYRHAVEKRGRETGALT